MVAIGEDGVTITCEPGVVKELKAHSMICHLKHCDAADKFIDVFFTIKALRVEFNDWSMK